MAKIVLADSLFESCAALSLNHEGQVMAFIRKFRANPERGGLNLERVRQAKDPDIYSARITQDLRAIIQRVDDTYILLYAGHHDDAYDWASKKRAKEHPVSHAIQIVEYEEVIQERVAQMPRVYQVPPIFEQHTDDYLISLGVPPEALPLVRAVTSQKTLEDVISSLPEEVAERLIDLSAGYAVEPPAPLAAHQEPVEHPDSRRRFFVVGDDEELERILAAPLASWITFLHPSQRDLAEGRYRGPLKVTGTAGTGKTVVAMHRARNLARQGRFVLLTTYSRELTSVIERNLRLLCSPEERARITVQNVHSLARAIVAANESVPRPIDGTELNGIIKRNQERTGCTTTVPTLRAEWDLIIEPQRITTWEAYRRASRAGRGTPLSVEERRRWWDVFAGVYEDLGRARATTWSLLAARAAEIVAPEMEVENTRRRAQAERVLALVRDKAEFARAQGRFDRAAEREAEREASQPSLLRLVPETAAGSRLDAERERLLSRRQDLEAEEARLRAEDAAARGRSRWAYDAVIVDEVQDLGPHEIRLLSTLAGEGVDRLTLIGDGGQRIYARKFSLRSLGIEVRGRSHTLRINYRTTEQIRRFADRVVSEVGDDLDGGSELRRNCRSLIHGPEPAWRGFAVQHEQYAFIAEQIRNLTNGECSLDEIAVLAYTKEILATIHGFLTARGIRAALPSQSRSDPEPAVSLLTMHGAKGREFKVVFVADVAAGIIPHVLALKDVTDPQDRDEALTLQRQLLYVCLTRARDQVYITWAGEPSPLLLDALTAPPA